MIRFNCPHCNRFYELHPALARLPLVCKQCGQAFTPPEAEPEPPPPPPLPKPAPPPPKPVAKAPVPPAVPVVAPAPKPAKPAAAPPVEDEEDDGVLVTGPAAGPDIDFNVGGPTAASLSDANRAKPAGLSDANRPRPADAPGDDINLDLLPPAPPPPPARKRAAKPPEPEPEAAAEKRAEPTLVPFLADLAAFAVLVVVGMFLGELLARKPTGAVLSEAGSAPQFPPMDLLLWAAPPVTFALIYLLLNSRGQTLGAWLRRRATR